ncbi:MAG TPA: PAS domain-containing protein [Aquabacterium sp.]|uniref:PAS domain-containing protein n=1 Tax=Aquabacterium sp. TaxID=1872578 RepID=UPI002E2FAB35|nr:PAS domain-containing protein [Aquabacterium sp.]HEX5372258.1 PAS domain-containing protein [Aquabacterium sp.]
MHPQVPDSMSPSALRSQAQALLARSTHTPAGDASAALGVLHTLASSPETAADALALLHELQVHQVELELQAEAMRNAQASLEAELAQWTHRHDLAPVSCFTVDRDTRIIELNQTGQQRLGMPPEALRGRALSEFLSADSAHDLHTMLTHLNQGHDMGTCLLTLTAPDHTPRPVHASARLDPASTHIMIALMDKSASPSSR